MLLLKGYGASCDIVIGQLVVYNHCPNQVPHYCIEEPENEIKRFQTARKNAISALQTIYINALTKVSEENAAIFEVQQMMLDDLDYINAIEDIIRLQKVNTEYAVNITAKKIADIFTHMEDEYMISRAKDVHDISNKLISCLDGKKNEQIYIDKPVILATDDLTPSEIMQLTRGKVIGIITAQGSTNSHTAILAHALGIPAVSAVTNLLTEAIDNTTVIMDCSTGNIYLDPDEKTLALMYEKINSNHHREKQLEKLKGKPNITQSGLEIKLGANIGSTQDLTAVLENDADSIGLFRSEFLYLNNKKLPTEEEQFFSYKMVAETMAGKPVIIRTLDIGADKNIPYLKLPPEYNPAMGYRGIRICLTQPEIFIVQLRAILRASAFGNISIMLPMITSVQEVQDVKIIFAGVKTSLLQEKISFDKNVKLGIMIETPAAAIISDDLAKEVDFFSIGTNDLTQYTLAMDRQNPNLGSFFNPHHKAIIKLIAQTVANAHKNGILVGICGELASDTSLTKTFLDLGVDELSVSPYSVLAVREKIRSLE
jgi:phosphoenolpyruvate-protein phosphotransferase (PTS system enzyme I)